MSDPICYMSESTGKILTALIEIQATLEMPKRTEINIETRSKFAPLHAVVAVIRKMLQSHKLCLINYRQFVSYTNENGVVVNREALFTQLTHESGEYVRTFTVLRPFSSSPQAMASCETAARRYNIKSLFNIVEEDEDDDGNAASGAPAIASDDSHRPAAASAPVVKDAPPQPGTQRTESQNYKTFKANFSKLAGEGKKSLLLAFIKERLTDNREIDSATKMVDEYFKTAVPQI